MPLPQISVKKGSKIYTMGRPDNWANVPPYQYLKIARLMSSQGNYTDPFVLGAERSANAATTGIPDGVELNGNINARTTINTNGYILERKTINEQIIVNGQNVVIRFNKIVGIANPSYIGEGLIIVNSGASVLIEQNDIGQTPASQTWYMNGIKLNGGTATIHRNNIHDVLDAIYISANAPVNFTVTGNYMHDFMFRSDDTNQTNSTPSQWSHNDCFQIRGGSGLIRGNNFVWTASELTGMPRVLNPVDAAPYLWRNAHILILQGAATNVTIQENDFAYAAIGIQFTTANGGNTATLIDNRFTPNQSKEFNMYRQMYADDADWVITGAETSTWSNHPDTPAGIRGTPVGALTSGYTLAYNKPNPTPSPNGSVKPFV